MAPSILFDGVWKKFTRGERHDSLRDLIPATFRGLIRKQPSSDLSAAEFWALHGVSFSVAAGQSLGIIGHNGAGKSTALKLLTRILKPTRGHSQVIGRVGALIEVAAGFHPDLTGRENVYLQGAIMGMSQGDIARRFDQIVAFSGVESFIDTPLKRYSSGMNARLGFAIAAHLEPEVLIIDEVLAVGDSMFQARCLERIRQLKQSGVALAFVSHNLPAVESLCDRVLWLDHGTPRFHGDPRIAISQYLNSGSVASVSESATYVPNDERLIGFACIQLLAHDDVPATTIDSGSEVSLKFSVRSNDAARQAIVGFAFRSLDNHCVFGENNTVASAPLELRTGSSIETRVVIRSLVLPEGRYHIDFALECPTTGEVFHKIDRAITFEVIVRREANRIGSLSLKTSWNITTPREEHSGLSLARQ